MILLNRVQQPTGTFFVPGARTSAGTRPWWFTGSWSIADGRSTAADAGARGEKSISSCPPLSKSSDQAFRECADGGRLFFSCISSSSPRLAWDPMPPRVRRLAEPPLIFEFCFLFNGKRREKIQSIRRCLTAKLYKRTFLLPTCPKCRFDMCEVFKCSPIRAINISCSSYASEGRNVNHRRVN